MKREAFSVLTHAVAGRDARAPSEVARTTKEIAMLARATVFIYGIFCYLAFFATFLYAIGFVGDLYVPKSIDSGAQGTLAAALLVGALLILVPPALYMASPDLYSEYQTLLEERSEEALKHLAADQDPSTPQSGLGSPVS